MGDVVNMPTAPESKREQTYDAAAFLLRIAALVLLVTAIPLNIWLWTVAL